MNKFKDILFCDISTEENFYKYSDKISKLTHRSKKDLFYLLYANEKSYAFCIMLKDEILGFQGFVYKPILINDKVIPSFRSEFTIALSELRGTGIFPKFYKYTMNTIRNDYNEVYFWGETKHKGWLNFDFKMIKRHTFYQIFSKRFKHKVKKPKIYNQFLVNAICVLLSLYNPMRHLFKRPVIVTQQITYDNFKKFELNEKKFKLHLYMDKEIFQWRYLKNDFQKYLFITYKESLIIIQEKDQEVIIVDIYAKNSIQYLFLLTYLTREYETVILHGNLFVMARVSYFWINILFGFATFFGGGAFVEHNRYAKQISWKDIPLLDSWQWGL